MSVVVKVNVYVVSTAQSRRKEKLKKSIGCERNTYIYMKSIDTHKCI